MSLDSISNPTSTVGYKATSVSGTSQERIQVLKQIVSDLLSENGQVALKTAGVSTTSINKIDFSRYIIDSTIYGKPKKFLDEVSRRVGSILDEWGFLRNHVFESQKPEDISVEENFSSGKDSEKKEIIQLVDGVTYNQNTWIFSDGKGKEVQLTMSEATIFCALLKQPFKVFSRDSLLDALFDYGERGERIINTFIMRIREKLSPFGLRDILKTCKRQGFILQTGGFDITLVKNKTELGDDLYYIPEYGGIYMNGEIKFISSGFLPIITKLLGKKGQSFSNEMLMGEAGMKVGSSKVVISKIRKELNTISLRLGNRIKTAWGQGYYWE